MLRQSGAREHRKWLRMPQRQGLSHTPLRRARSLWSSSAGKRGPQSSPGACFTSLARWRRQPRSRRPRARRQPLTSSGDAERSSRSRRGGSGSSRNTDTGRHCARVQRQARGGVPAGRASGSGGCHPWGGRLLTRRSPRRGPRQGQRRSPRPPWGTVVSAVRPVRRVHGDARQLHQGEEEEEEEEVRQQAKVASRVHRISTRCRPPRAKRRSQGGKRS